MRPSDEFDLNFATTVGDPPPDRRLWAACAALGAGFAAVLGWSLWPAEEPVVAAEEPVVAAEDVAAEDVAAEAADPEVASSPAAETRAWTPARRVSGLERLTLGVLQAGGGRPSPIRLREALGDAVAVVNVWAGYCAPCLRELPGILELARKDGWGRTTRLVPVLAEPLREADPRQATMLAALRGEPSALRLLVDPEATLGGLVREAGVVKADALPMTLVFACGALTWARVGELDPPTLADAVAAAREELAGCRPEPAPAEATGVAGCGDAVCGPEESCASCRLDCGCADGKACVVDAGGAGRCVRPVEELKP